MRQEQLPDRNRRVSTAGDQDDLSHLLRIWRRVPSSRATVFANR